MYFFLFILGESMYKITRDTSPEMYIRNCELEVCMHRFLISEYILNAYHLQGDVYRCRIGDCAGLQLGRYYQECMHCLTDTAKGEYPYFSIFYICKLALSALL